MGGNTSHYLNKITQREFEALVNKLAAAVSQQASDSSVSPSETKSLQQMDKQMNGAVKNVKRVIDYRFGDAATGKLLKRVFCV